MSFCPCILNTTQVLKNQYISWYLLFLHDSLGAGDFYQGFDIKYPHSAGHIPGSLTAEPGGRQFATFVEIDHEIISSVILPSAESFKKGCCQLQAKVCARLLVNCLFKLAQEKCG